MTRPQIALTIALCLTTTSLEAGYKRTGDVKGNVCTSYLIVSACRTVSVDAVSEDGVNYFTLVEEFGTVSEFNESIKLCHVQTNAGWFHWALSFFYNTTKFYTKGSDGKFERIYPEYVSFHCEPTPP